MKNAIIKLQEHMESMGIFVADREIQKQYIRGLQKHFKHVAILLHGILINFYN